MKIIVPTDYSTCADHAAKLAIDFAKKIDNSSIYLTHVFGSTIGSVDITYDIPAFEESIRALRLGAESKLNKSVDALIQSTGFERIKGHLIFNDFVEFIFDDPLVKSADLLVVGSRGANGPKEFFLGSKAQKILRKAEVPVFVVKENARSLDVKKVMLLSNFGENMQKGFDQLRCLMKPFDPTYLLTHVIDQHSFHPTQTALAKIEFFRNENMLENSEIIIHTDYHIEDGLNYLIKKHQPDLVMMFTHGYKGIERWLKGSLTEELVNHTKANFLCAHI